LLTPPSLQVFRVDYGHAEVTAHTGKDPREYSISTKEFVSDGEGKIKGVNTIRVAWEKDALGQWRMGEIAGSEQVRATPFARFLLVVIRN
jgi:glutamate synthase (NADPH/NADH)